MMWKERMDICGDEALQKACMVRRSTRWSGEVWQGKVAGPRNAV